MRPIWSLVLYTALLLGANAAPSGPAWAAEGAAAPDAATLEAPEAASVEALEALRDGSMKKLTFHAAPREVPDVPFEGIDGAELRLSDYRGKHVLVNFWATWCAPCRKEMPGLAALQEAYGGADFEVLTVATGRNPKPAMRAFFEDIDVDNLPLHRDPKQALARKMGVLGLPITVLIDPEGRELARLPGDAEWDSDSARAIIAALLQRPEG